MSPVWKPCLGGPIMRGNGAIIGIWARSPPVYANEPLTRIPGLCATNPSTSQTRIIHSHKESHQSKFQSPPSIESRTNTRESGHKYGRLGSKPKYLNTRQSSRHKLHLCKCLVHATTIKLTTNTEHYQQEWKLLGAFSSSKTVKT